jgi:hypothetical protein
MDSEKPQKPVMDVTAPPVRPAPALPDNAVAEPAESADVDMTPDKDEPAKPQLPQNHRPSVAGIVAVTLLFVAALVALTILVYIKSR